MIVGRTPPCQTLLRIGEGQIAPSPDPCRIVFAANRERLSICAERHRPLIQCLPDFLAGPCRDSRILYNERCYGPPRQCFCGGYSVGWSAFQNLSRPLYKVWRLRYSCLLPHWSRQRENRRE